MSGLNKARAGERTRRAVVLQPLARVASIVLVSFAIAATAPGSTRAQTQTGAQGKPFVVVVFGDSLADGLWAAMYHRFRGNRGVRVIRATKVSSGFTAFNYMAKLQQLLASYEIGLMVIQVGANDRQRMVAHGKGLIRFKSDLWLETYKERIGEFLGKLNEAKVPTYWVGLPIMRDGAVAKDSQLLNRLYREVAKAKGVTYVSTWRAAAGPDGKYAAFFTDSKGRRIRFRADDGIHFSFPGYDVIAGHVLSVIRTKQPKLLPN